MTAQAIENEHARGCLSEGGVQRGGWIALKPGCITHFNHTFTTQMLYMGVLWSPGVEVLHLGNLYKGKSEVQVQQVHVPHHEIFYGHSGQTEEGT